MFNAPLNNRLDDTLEWDDDGDTAVLSPVAPSFTPSNDDPDELLSPLCDDDAKKFDEEGEEEEEAEGLDEEAEGDDEEEEDDEFEDSDEFEDEEDSFLEDSDDEDELEDDLDDDDDDDF